MTTKPKADGVTRYKPVITMPHEGEGNYKYAVCVESPDGEYVLYSEYEKVLKACKLIQAHLDDLGESNPGYMGKLCLQDYALWNEAYIALAKALAQWKGKVNASMARG